MSTVAESLFFSSTRWVGAATLASLISYYKRGNFPELSKVFRLSFIIKFAFNTGLFISPSGISELDCATTKADTAERSISIGRESLQVFFLY